MVRLDDIPEPDHSPPPADQNEPQHPRTAGGTNNPPPQHLLDEDRPEYERILDEALRSAPTRPELAAVGKRLNPEQLRTMALNATALITAAAAPEYQHYVQVREELRQRTSSVHEPGSTQPGGVRAIRFNTTLGEALEGAGPIAVAAILIPVLAAAATAIFLSVGYVRKLFSPESAFARIMLTVGWGFGALTAAAVLIGAVGLLFTALHNEPSPSTSTYGVAGGEVTRAKKAWHDALLERGILPFLQEVPVFQAVLAHVGAPAPHSSASPASPGRPPHLGYDRPDFTSPDRPDFTSPGFSSPDFGQTEHHPE